MLYFLLFMLAFNCYIAGYVHANEHPGIKRILVLLFLGLPIYLLFVAYALGDLIVDILDKLFKVRFWWDYYIRRDIEKYIRLIPTLDRNYQDIKNRKDIKAYFWLKGYHIIKRHENKK